MLWAFFSPRAFEISVSDDPYTLRKFSRTKEIPSEFCRFGTTYTCE